eukprot:m.44837 g.44837  ORF g.44837 m.44837 type:complete len:346 (+) comp14598_c0_seq1:211-1248(+)
MAFREFGYQPAWFPGYAAVPAPEFVPQMMRPRPQDTGELSKTNIYITGLKPNTTDDDLKAWCQKFGTIVSAKAIIDREQGHCKGFGFVMFEKEASARAAVDALVRSGAQAAFAKITKAQLEYQGRQEADPTNLYMTNLPKELDEPGLTALLTKTLETCPTPSPEVVSCRILRDDSTNQSRGVGLARMESKETCEFIISKLNGTTQPGCTEPLRIKFANGPSARKFKQNAMARAQHMYPAEMPFISPMQPVMMGRMDQFMAIPMQQRGFPPQGQLVAQVPVDAKGDMPRVMGVQPASAPAGSRLAAWVGSTNKEEAAAAAAAMGMAPMPMPPAAFMPAPPPQGFFQ